MAGIVYSTLLHEASFDPRTTSPTDVRFAFVFPLPFRLRLGALYRQDFEARDRRVSLWLRNRTLITADKPGIAQLQGGPISQLWTEALLVIHDPVISEDSLAPLRAAAPDAKEVPYPQADSESFNAMEALNHFIIGYSTATNQFLGGAPLRIFRYTDLPSPRWQITFLGSRINPISDEAVQTMFDLKPERRLSIGGSISGDLHDLPPEATSGIGRAIALHRDFVFYEFAFEAKARMFEGDVIGALLMAVIAFEGAHGAYIQAVLASKLPKGSKSSLPARFLKSLGIAQCNSLTPYIFMTPEERPEPELITKGHQAIEFRNEIAHSLRSKGGGYRRRMRTNRELSDAYAAALKLYECYRAAFERLAARNTDPNDAA